MCAWPTATESLRDSTLEAEVGVVRGAEEAGSRARQEAGRKLRWPVRRVVVAPDDADIAAAVRAHDDLLADRLNARTVTVLDPGRRYDELAYTARADMSVLGPAFGDRAGEVMEALNAATVEEPTVDALEAAVADALDGEELTEEMVEFVETTPEDVAAADFEGGTVYVDATLTEAIESEGYAREVIRRVQEMRKDLELEMDADIRLAVEVGDPEVEAYVADHETLIREEVRATELGDIADPALAETWDIEGVTVEIAIEPVAGAAA